MSQGDGAIPIEAIRQALLAREPGWIVGRALEHHARIDSTSDRVRELAAAGAPEGTVVVAEEQSRGRGRAGRAWHSAPGVGVYLSVLLRPRVAPDQLPLVALVSAVAAAEALAQAAGVPVRIKWPNDLVTDAAAGPRRKLAGVLTEGRAGSDGVRDVVVGVGVNVNHVPEDFPEELRDRAGSLRMERGRPVDRAQVLLDVMTSLERWYRAWLARGPEPVLAEYRRLAVDLEGRAVRVREAEEMAWEGVTRGLADDGSLRIEPLGGGPRAAGGLVLIRHGEVDRVLDPAVRPAGEA